MTTLPWIRTIYLYLITAITIVMVIIALVTVVKMALEYVFDVKSYEEISVEFQCQDSYQIKGRLGKPTPAYPTDPQLAESARLNFTPEEKQECLKKAQEEAEKQAKNNRKRELVWSLAMVIVALPIYSYHWKMIQRDHKTA